MIQSFLSYIDYLIVALLFVYVRQIFIFYLGLKKLTRGSNTRQESVTVIVAARNEEQNIERCLDSLLNQNYPKDKFSVFIVDDYSTDRTAAIAESVAKRSEIPMKLFFAKDYKAIKSPKLKALAEGVRHASATIVATTDADCVAPPSWLRTIVSHFDEGVGVVAGVTVYDKPKNISELFWGIQFLDFISYTAVGAGAIGWNRVLISNGSNMAFRLDALNEAGGFEAIKHINTGTDSLIAQKIAESGKWKPRFLFEPEGAIVTQPVQTVKEAFYQRARWVGQTSYYPPYMMFFMLSTFIMFVLLTVALPITIINRNMIPWIVLFLKFFADFITMDKFTRLTNTRDAMKYFIPMAIIHIPFILVATVYGYFFSFVWKKRMLRKEVDP